MGKKGLLVSFVLLFLTTTFSVQGGEMTKEVSYLNSRPSAVDKEALAQKVHTDFHSISDNGRNDIVHYTVPAISNLKRTEDFYPEDGIRADRCPSSQQRMNLNLHPWFYMRLRIILL